MSEALAKPVSALGGLSSDGLISVREMPPQGMITLRGDLSAAYLKEAVTGVCGCAMPAARMAVTEGARGILWMSPDELLVLCPYRDVTAAVADLSERLSGEHKAGLLTLEWQANHWLAVDVSDARAVFELRGGGLREVLAKLTPADVSPDALPLGEVRRTRLAQVPAAFWLTSETRAQVICFRSVAQYVFDLFKTAAQPGSEVGYF